LEGLEFEEEGSVVEVEKRFEVVATYWISSFSGISGFVMLSYASVSNARMIWI
jgi:hypothetical protein